MAEDKFPKLRAQLKYLVKRDTAAFIKKLAEPEVGSKLSAKAKAVIEVLRNKDFGNSKEPLRSLMGIVLGEELPSIKEASTLYVNSGWLAVMCISDKVSAHEYHVNQVAAKLPGFEFSYTDQFVKQSGRIGGHMSADAREVRPATNEEIDAYIDKLSDDSMTHMEKRVVVIELPPDLVKEVVKAEPAKT